MRYLPTARQMKEADRHTISKLGIPSLELMERAAAGCVKVMKEKRLDLSRVCIVCGSGNNGGDGFAIGRMLLEDGCRVTAVMAGNRERCTDECREQLRLFEEAGGIVGNEYSEQEYGVIVDALFGVGLSRGIEGRYLSLLDAMNRSGAYKFAVDIPSGVSADTGNILGAAFHADLTVTFQEKKFGMEVYPGKELSGNVVTADIGISGQTLWEDETAVAALRQRITGNFFRQEKRIPIKEHMGKCLWSQAAKECAARRILMRKRRIGRGQDWLKYILRRKTGRFCSSFCRRRSLPLMRGLMKKG